MRSFIAAAILTIAPLTVMAQSSSTSAQGQQVTVTGCLEAPRGGTAAQFTLTTAAPSNAPGTPAAKAAAGAPGTTAPVVETATYALVPSQNVDLKAHVGHTVELSGTESGPQATAATKETSDTAAPPPPARKRRK